MDASATLQVPTIESPRWFARDSVSMWLAITIAGCAVAFGALHHPYWVRGGDGDAYIGLARSIALGQGYRFNGQPVSLIPPLWPYVLAGAMKITASFAMLKLLTIGLLLIGISASYFILLRLTTPARAATILLATALLPHVYELGFWFLAEPMFFALFSLAMLLAIQINEGHEQIWRLVALTILCAALVSVRWAGLIIWPVIGAALLNRDWRPQLSRRWLVAVISAAMTAATFIILRKVLAVDPKDIDLQYDATLSGAYATINAGTLDDYIRRIGDSGRWMCGLFWHILTTTSALRAVVDILGWLAVLWLLLAAWAGLRTRRWLYPAVALYCGLLIVNWTSPVSRYLMPVAPLLLCAMLDGADRFRRIFAPSIDRAMAVALPRAILISVIAVGLALWAIEVRIARSSRFPARVFGGVDCQLVAAAAYMNAKNVGDGEVVVSRAWNNLGRTQFTNLWMRALNVLNGGKSVRSIPTSLSRMPSREVVKWLRSKKARFYLYQPAHNVWMTHFRVDDPKKTQETPDWILFEIIDKRPRQVRLGLKVDWPTRVPGL